MIVSSGTHSGRGGAVGAVGWGGGGGVDGGVEGGGEGGQREALLKLPVSDVNQCWDESHFPSHAPT